MERLPKNQSKELRPAALPGEFIKRMQKVLGGCADAFFDAYSAPPAKAVHINTQRCGGLPGITGLSPLFPFPSNCYKTENRSLGAHPYHAAGVYYLQEPSAMLPALAADMPEGARVLDMCAAPGGKTSQLATILGGKGILVANEYDRARAAVLKENVTRMGYTNVSVVNMFPGGVAEELPGFFDIVLVDAPCSGEGMFRKNPDAAREWSVSHVQACARRQKEIVSSAAGCLKTGGLLIYSTCTFAPEEDEEIVKFIMTLGFELVPVKEEIAALGVDTGYGVKYFPHMFGEGQFVAVLRKTASAAPVPEKKYKNKPISKNAYARLSEIMDTSGMDISESSGIIYTTLPILPPFDFAVRLGSIEKDGRLTPAHSLFTAYGGRCHRSVNVGAVDAKKYIAGDELEVYSPDGWGCLKVDGFSLGGYKSSDGKLKNRYPKPLRQ